jgi:hypothetical protein
MKSLFLLTLTLTCIFFVKAQDIQTIYGYRNVIARGNIPVVPNEIGGKTPVELPTHEYNIFVKTNNGKTPVITKMIVESKLYKVAIEKVQKVPVVYTYFTGEEKSITLIDKHQKNIFKIVLQPEPIEVDTKINMQIIINYKLGKVAKTKNLKFVKELPSSEVY